MVVRLCMAVCVCVCICVVRVCVCGQGLKTKASVIFALVTMSLQGAVSPTTAPLLAKPPDVRWGYMWPDRPHVPGITSILFRYPA